MITSTIIGMSYESNKNAHLFFHLGAIFIRLNALGRVSKLTQLMSIFTSNFFFKFLIKIQLIQEGQGVKSISPDMPIRVEGYDSK